MRLIIARNTAEATFAATKKALKAAKKTLEEAEIAHNQAKAVYLAVVDAEKEINNNFIYVEPGDVIEEDPDPDSFFKFTGEAQSHVKLIKTHIKDAEVNYLSNIIMKKNLAYKNT